MIYEPNKRVERAMRAADLAQEIGLLKKQSEELARHKCALDLSVARLERIASELLTDARETPL